MSIHTLDISLSNIAWPCKCHCVRELGGKSAMRMLRNVVDNFEGLPSGFFLFC